MSYSLDKFSSFEPGHQQRLIYKLLNAGEKVHHFASAIADDRFSQLVEDSKDERQRQTLLAFLENALGRSVMDADILSDDGEPASVGSADISAADFGARDGSREVRKVPFDVLLHDMRSAHNVGAILRSAECFGFRKVFLTGYTPTPEQSVVQKTAMGVEEHIEWQQLELEEVLASHSGPVVALELADEAVDVQKCDFQEDSLFVLGNEKYGVPKELLSKASTVVKIPLYGWKNSLNVSNAFAILAHEVRKSYER